MRRNLAQFYKNLWEMFDKPKVLLAALIGGAVILAVMYILKITEKAPGKDAAEIALYYFKNIGATAGKIMLFLVTYAAILLLVMAISKIYIGIACGIWSSEDDMPKKLIKVAAELGIFVVYVAMLSAMGYLFPWTSALVYSPVFLLAFNYWIVKNNDGFNGYY